MFTCVLILYLPKESKVFTSNIKCVECQAFLTFDSQEELEDYLDGDEEEDVRGMCGPCGDALFAEELEKKKRKMN